MSAIFSTFIDSPDLTACFAADTSLDEINDRAAESGLYFPLFLDGCRSVAAHLAAGTHLPASHRFGTLADNILGMNFQPRGGQTVRIGGRSIKNCTGFDINRFLLNSRHAFGQASAFVLRLRALPGKLQWFRFCAEGGEIEKFRRILNRSPWWHSLECVDVEVRPDTAILWIGFRGSSERTLQCRKWLTTQIPIRHVEEMAPSLSSLESDALIKTMPSRAVEKASCLVERFGGEARIHLTSGFVRWQSPKGNAAAEALSKMREDCAEEGGHLVSPHLAGLMPADEAQWVSKLEGYWKA